MTVPRLAEAARARLIDEIRTAVNIHFDEVQQDGEVDADNIVQSIIEHLDHTDALRAALEAQPQMPLSEACLRGGCQYGPSSGHAPSPLKNMTHQPLAEAALEAEHQPGKPDKCARCLSVAGGAAPLTEAGSELDAPNTEAPAGNSLLGEADARRLAGEMVSEALVEASKNVSAGQMLCHWRVVRALRDRIEPLYARIAELEREREDVAPAGLSEADARRLAGYRNFLEMVYGVTVPDIPFFIRLIDSAHARIAELERTFDLQWEADQRAIKMWQEAHPGNEIVWPDRGKMIFWCLERIAELERERDAWHRLLDALQAKLDERNRQLEIDAEAFDRLAAAEHDPEGRRQLEFRRDALREALGAK